MQRPAQMSLVNGNGSVPLCCLLLLLLEAWLATNMEVFRIFVTVRINVYNLECILDPTSKFLASSVALGLTACNRNECRESSCGGEA
jgi:hypothetical protein